MLSPERASRYEELSRRFGNTPLYSINHIEVGNNNRILCKEEWLNRTWSHYDRVFFELLKQYEDSGYNHTTIYPGVSHIVETTSGNAGASLAWLCQELGYECTVFIPEDMPGFRIAQIQAFGANVVLTPAGEYIKGCNDKFVRYVKSKAVHKEHKRQRYETLIASGLSAEEAQTRIERYATMAVFNHSANQIALDAMYGLGREIVENLKNHELHYFVSALGNGNSLAGIGQALREEWPNIKILGVEPYECPCTFLQKFGVSEFEERYGEKPVLGPHNLIGTGGWGMQFDRITEYLSQVDDIVLVKEVDWRERFVQLEEREKKPVGRTSAACLHVALGIAERESHKNILTLFYDASWKYDG